MLAAASGALGSLERIERAEAAPVLAVRTAAADGAPGWSTLMLVDEREASGRLDRLRIVLAVLFAIVLGLAGVRGGALAAAGGEAARRRRRVDGARRRRRPLDPRPGARTPASSARSSPRFNTMVEEVERSRDELQRTEALRREVEIAHQIQTAILPVSPAVKGFEVAARMEPADDVGGDLYDILAFGDTFWVLVGDVSGHGVNSGLVMMMAQAAAYAAIADDPHCRPSAVIAAVNRVVHENVRRRMGATTT